MNLPEGLSSNPPLSAYWALPLSQLRNDPNQSIHDVSKFLSHVLGARLPVEKADERGAAVILIEICNFFLRPGDHENPWKAREYTADGRRSSIADDLTEEQLEILSQFAPDIENAVLKARVSDVLWECKVKGGYKHALDAISSYRLISKSWQEHGDWHEAQVARERSFELAARLGKRNPILLELVDELDDTASKLSQGGEPDSSLIRIIYLLLPHRTEKALDYADMAEDRAVQALAEGEYRISVAFWRLATDCRRRSDDLEAIARSEIAMGEALAAQGYDLNHRRRLGPGYSAHWLLEAVEVLRRSGAPQERVIEIHRDALKLQKQALQNFTTSSIADAEGFEDIQRMCQEAAGEAERLVSGLPLDEAIARLATICPTTNVDELRQLVLKGSQLRFFVTVNHVDADGKTKGSSKTGSGFSPGEEQIVDAMHEDSSRYFRAYVCDSAIEPARRTIWREHRLRPSDLYFLVANNPFIPPGREEIYLRGLLAGLNGDFMVASHLLIPQLENSIRRILMQAGVITSKLEEDIQQDQTLGWLLTRPELANIFTTSQIFDLRGILIEKLGDNFRNMLCHGLVDSESFMSTAPCYIWWLTLHLVWLGTSALPEEI
jgi:hypothetical protein